MIQFNLCHKKNGKLFSKIILIGGIILALFFVQVVGAEVEQNLLLEMSFDEGSGMIAGDSSGNCNDGVISGATWTTGKAGNALFFDGVDDYVQLPNNSVFGSVNDFTISAWIKSSTVSGWDSIVTFGDSGGDELFFGLASGEMVIYSQDLSPNYVTGDTTLNTGEWYHVTAVRKGANYYFYLNGQDDGSGVWNATTINFNGTCRAIGSDAGCPRTDNEHFDGIIDEVKIYNRALTAQEVLDSYNSSEGVDPPCVVTCPCFTAVELDDTYNDGWPYSDSSCTDHFFSSLIAPGKVHQITMQSRELSPPDPNHVIIEVRLHDEAEIAFYRECQWTHEGDDGQTHSRTFTITQDEFDQCRQEILNSNLWHTCAGNKF